MPSLDPPDRARAHPGPDLDPRRAPGLDRAHLKRLLPFLFLAVVTVAGVVYGRGPRAAGPLGELERARPDRVFSARFSIPTEYHACTPDPLFADSLIPRHTCGEHDDAPRFLDELIASAGESTELDLLHAAGLGGVLWWDGMSASLDDAIAQLYAALPITEDPLPLLVDLSAAHLVRAEQTQSSRDLLEALERALEALAIDPRNGSAQYNAAWASEALGIEEQAIKEWNAYLAQDRTSLWAAEARAHRDALLARHVLRQPTPASSDAEVEEFAARDPGRARQVAVDSILGRWGEAVLAGKSARADSLLSLVDRLVAALQRQNDDRSLADMAQSIHGARGDPAATHVLARAHRAYARGQATFTKNQEVALGWFEQVLHAQPDSPVLLAWTRAFLAGAHFYMGSEIALPMFDSLLAHVDSARYPAITARVHWMRGTAHIRTQQSREARDHYAAAARAFGRLRELESYGASLNGEGWARYQLGDTLAAYRLMHESLLTLRHYRNSVRLQGVLLELAHIAGRDGMVNAVVPIQEEGYSLALKASDPVTLSEALQAQARFRAVRGDYEGAARALDSAAVIARRLRDARQEAHFANLLRYSRALASSGAANVAELDSAIAFFAGSNAIWRLAALMRRADLRLASSDLQGATADLDSITAQIRRLAEDDEEADVHTRAAIMDQARSRFDRLVMLHVRAGQPREALQALERGRISVAPLASGAAPGGSPLAAPPGYVALEYALIGDTLLTWIVRDSAVTMLRDTVSRGELLLTIRRLTAAWERPGRDAEARPYQHRLYDLLVRPVEARIPRDARLLILADGEIAGVPFAGLRDSARGEYLLEKHVIRMAPTLADAARPPPSGAGLPALLVADPAFDPIQNPRLDRLTGAGTEVDSLAPLYPGAWRLRGAAATVDSLLARAPHVGIIHYAGHAVFDDSRPERSYLVMAGPGERGWLRADAVGALDLSRVRLVVLSACRTLRAREGRSGGFAGLSGAFLSARAGGVVGSLWQVSDSLTQPLMVSFHREYAHSRDAAAALREAQLRMLRSREPLLRSPAAWAGFRYVGR